MALQGSTQDEETRVLLLLFGLEGLGQLVKKTKLGICRSNEKASDYTPIFEGLVQQGLISYGTRKASKKKASSEPVADQNILSLTQAGYDHLITALKSGDFQLKGQQFGSKVVNALIKLIREAPSSPSPEVSPQISSYDQFKAVALETY
ncbi:MAG: hypothetical protein SFT94_11155, partial [Pseudanabaenaceae cyanobacterium bins.68]|nr:hypothetical protein [Pseudanabaenaceae cyanobacterium bins.68]